ncbi:MAG: hypothetical protein LAT77_11140 [Aliidiomarina sp.]|uniref:hypothetical protein n=1 Tax=Aliidiomarina sp. TaxID=1872439 RepID=UPI0025BDBF9C|nr:hypothetical protein [Aliidiomarina sp.]MCH8502450.1 hypothetical protein [Aliidiomarina sp.]
MKVVAGLFVAVLIAVGYFLIAGESDYTGATTVNTQPSMTSADVSEAEPNSNSTDFIEQLSARMGSSGTLMAAEGYSGEIGEYIDPDTYISESRGEPRSIGEYIDPDNYVSEPRNSEPVNLGETIRDPLQYTTQARNSTPINIGENIPDPEAWVARQARSRYEPREIGERKDPEID